jgi:hypothetical protein
MATSIALLEFMMLVAVVLIAVLAAFGAIALLSSGKHVTAGLPRPNRDSYRIYMPKGRTLSASRAKQRVLNHV